MKFRTFTLVSLTLLALIPIPASADDMNMPMSMPMDGKESTVEAHHGKGIINSVDAKAGKINLTHEAIKSLDWPGMTMDFDVQDKTKLTNLKPGQKVTFTLIEVRKGKYAISDIAVAK